MPPHFVERGPMKFLVKLLVPQGVVPGSVVSLSLVGAPCLCPQIIAGCWHHQYGMRSNCIFQIIPPASMK